MSTRRLNRYTGRDEVSERLERQLSIERRRVRILLLIVGVGVGWAVMSSLLEVPRVRRILGSLYHCMAEEFSMWEWKIGRRFGTGFLLFVFSLISTKVRVLTPWLYRNKGICYHERGRSGISVIQEIRILKRYWVMCFWRTVVPLFTGPWFTSFCKIT